MAQSVSSLFSSDGASGKVDKAQGLFAKPPDGATETSYTLSTSFITLPNKLTFAKAATSGTARVFQVGAKMSYKVVNWAATRVGCPPLSPSPESDTQWTLLYTQLGGVSPGVGADGISKTYTVTGSYVYVRETPFTTSDSYELGVPPIYTYSTESATIDPEDFTDVMEGGGEPPSTGGGAPLPAANPSANLSSPTTTNTSPAVPPRRLPSLFDG